MVSLGSLARQDQLALLVLQDQQGRMVFFNFSTSNFVTAHLTRKSISAYVPLYMIKHRFSILVYILFTLQSLTYFCWTGILAICNLIPSS
jgi:hypothetical protein